MCMSGQKWRLLVSILLLAILFSRVPPVSAQSDQLIWAQVGGTVPSTVTLNSVFMLDEHTAWAVGDDGASGFAYRLTWQGDHWEAASQGVFPKPIRDIVALSAEDAWAVGDDGIVISHNANGWQLPSFQLPGATLRTIQIFGAGEEGWAGGELTTANGSLSPLLVHYQDGQWRQDTSITGAGHIASLHFNAGGGWAVGGDPSKERIWRYHKNRWSEEETPRPCADVGCAAGFSGVRAINADEVWAVGSRVGICAICTGKHYAIHRIGGKWQVVLPDAPVTNQPPDFLYGFNSSSFAAAYFSDPNHGLFVGQATIPGGPPGTRPLAIRYQGGELFFESTPVIAGALTSVSMTDATHALAVGSNGLILSYGYGTPPASTNPTARVEDPHDTNVVYFPQVGHTLRGAFHNYWERYGGLPQFGYPLTEEFAEGGYTVQYFERARFEYHPENQPPYDVLLGLLGHTVTVGRAGQAPFLPVQPPPGAIYFPETSHTLAPEFVDYWRTHGGLPIYGYPISEPFSEVNLADGKSYLVQYFERARFEYHPELSAAYKVSLGLLGTEVIRAKGWLAEM